MYYVLCIIVTKYVPVFTIYFLSQIIRDWYLARYLGNNMNKTVSIVITEIDSNNY